MNPSHNPGKAVRWHFKRGVAVVLLTMALAMTATAAETGTAPIEIQGSKRPSEGLPSTFAVFIPDRPVREVSTLYSPRIRKPNGNFYTATGYTPLDLIWDFGDGSPLVTIHEQTSVSHIYADNGAYEVTVIALDQQGQFATQTHSVEVWNRDPEDVTITATVLDANSHLVELAGTAMDAAGDSMSFRWDFGDGQSAEGDEAAFRAVQHRYPQAGDYEATLTINDDDYPWPSDEWHDGQLSTTFPVAVFGDGVAPASDQEAADPSSAEAPLHGRVIAQTGGALQFEFDGKIRSLAGLYLSPVKSGACRFMFTAWDNAHLANAMGVIDLFGVPPQGGRYRIRNPRFSLAFKADAADYQSSWGSLLGGFGFANLPGMNLTNRALQQIDDPDGDGSVDVSQLDDTSGDLDSNADAPVAASGSPLVDENVGFATSSGELVLDFVPGKYAVGQFNVTMTSADKQYRDQPLQVQAEIALDLNAAANDGIVRYAGCEGVPFKIKDVWPADGTVHMPVPRPRIRISFNDQVDPVLLTDETVQLLYKNAGDALVPVPSRLLRDDREVYLVPEAALLPGVEYLMRVKIGEDGVRSRSGRSLADEDGAEWHEWRFNTALDLVPETDGKQLLACHLFQPARDVPLIPGKPAVARIYANWEAVAGVASTAQTTNVNAVVKLIDDSRNELGSVDMTFVRPDRIESRNVDKRRAAHTAQIPFTPTADMKEPLYVDVFIAPEAGREPRRRYRARCAVKLWDRAPSLSISFFALKFDEWAEHPDRLQALMPTLQSVADNSLVYARQQFPFRDIQGSPVEVLTPTIEIPSKSPYLTLPDFKCLAGCIIMGKPDGGLFDEWAWDGIEDWLLEQSSADVIIVFGPHDRLDGGETPRELDSGRALAMVLAGSNPEYFPRYVNGVVHELGHALNLEHIPYVTSDAERIQVLTLREPNVAFRYESIEAMRIAEDGQTWWNKSSSEGNEQGSRLFPLMFPGTIPEDDAFIANHQYRIIQRYLKTLNRQ